MDSSPSFSERIYRFFNPSTQAELDNRRQQVNNTIIFFVATGLVVYFRKSLEKNLIKLSESM